MISKRAKSIDSSGIRRVFDLAAKLKDPVNLSIGRPDFDADPLIKQGAKQAIDQGLNSYTVTQGIEDLRSKIRSKYGITTESDLEVFVTSGVSGGLLLSYLALLDPGDEILIPDPYFVMYRDLALLINANPTYYDTYPDFKITAEQIESALTPRTKAVMINSPSNPTGNAIAQQELNQIVEVVKKAGIWLIYDEIYQIFCYDYPHATCFNKYQNTLILNGFSKSHGIPGWRIGYAVGPKSVINEMIKIQQYTFVCAPSIAQWGMLGGMDLSTAEITENYKQKRDLVYQGIKEKFEVTPSGGSFYLFPKAPVPFNGQTFVEKCIENNLLLIPGNVFSRKNSHFRISFAASTEQLNRGIEILNKLG